MTDWRTRWAKRKKVKHVSEVQRIIALPTAGKVSEDRREELSRENVLAPAYDEGVRLLEDQAAGLHAFLTTGRGFFSVKVGGGKCLSPLSEVYDPCQGRVLVGDVRRTISMTEDQKLVEAEARVVPQPVKECVQVHLSSGPTLTCSTDHPIFTPSGWIHAQNLKAGDLVATPRRIPDNTRPSPLTDTEVELAAFMLADGGLSRSSPMFTKTPGPVMERCKQVIEDLGGGWVNTDSRSNAEEIRLHGMWPTLKRLGLTRDLSKNKRVPSEFWALPNEQLALFVNVFVACDGHLVKDRPRAEVGLASLGLIKDLQFMLTRLGVQSRYRYKRAVCQTGEFDSWRLTCHAGDLIDACGPILGKEDHHYQPRKHQNVDVVPIGPVEARQIADELGLPRTPIIRALGATKGQRVSRAKFEWFVKQFDYRGSLAHHAHSDIRWVKISCVNSAGKQEVVDLNVPGYGNFVAEGMVVHNTALSQLIASHFFTANPDSKVLLLLETGTYLQFFHKALPWARENLAVNVPWFGLGKQPKQRRLALARCQRPGAYVLPYSLLSTEDTIEILNQINPKLIIADEAQNLRGQSAKTKRFWDYVRREQPAGVAMSGTLTTRTPLEYYELMRWCLGENCPLPLNKTEASVWSNLLRSDAKPPTQQELNDLRPLLRWAATPHNTQGIRKAYRQRLHTTPGFHTSGDKVLGVSLEIHNKPAGEPNQMLKTLFAKVSERSIHPDGDILRYGIEVHSALRELSAGFYYHRFWDETHPLVDQAKEHWKAGQEYSAELIQFFNSTKKPREGLDTPMLVGKHHHDHGAIKGWEHLFDLWEAWKALDHEDLPERQSEPVWIDEYKICHAAKFAKSLKGDSAILWCIHRAVADKLLIELRKRKVRCMKKGSGDSWMEGDGSERYVCVASIDAHGTGKNLQHFTNQMIVQWPRSATQIEQLIGRTHRTGQKAERLVVHTNLTTEWDHEQMACTLEDTRYQVETMGGRPKLLIADWNPLPKKFSRKYLESREWRLK